MTAMSLARPLQPGARIGKYRLVRRLASGGMGEVWVARNRATGASVAVKLCRADMASEETRSRFRHEARLGAMLSHRSIVRVFDLVEESGGTLLLIMELLRGETLEHHLRAHGPLATNEAVAIALPVLSALAHAHDCGVVHRDVTPSNIFLAVDPDGCVIPKLVDFGIAKLPASGVQTLDGRVLGTPRYMAPEQIRTPGDIDGRSDLFAMSVVLYEMLTGICPFAAGTPAASLAAVLEAVVDPDPQLEPRVWIELQRAMSKRAYERHEGALEMAKALRAASGETEEALNLRLRNLKLSSQQPPNDPPDAGWQSIEGRSVFAERAVSVRRGALGRWLLGAALAASLAVAGVQLFLWNMRHPSTASAFSPATTGPIATDWRAAPLTSPDPAAAVLPLADPPSTTMAPKSATGSSQPRPARTKRVKPVATTPGF